MRILLYMDCVDVTISMIETKRLLLRHWKLEDLNPFYKINSNPQVCKFLPKQLSASESDEFARKIIQKFDVQGFGMFALEEKENKEFIGFTGLNIPNFEAPFMPAIEMGWRLAVDYWGKGLATEAAFAVMDYAFFELKLSEIVSFTVPENTASRRVMEKIGMIRDPSADFCHPDLSNDHILSSHVLYRKRNSHV